MVLFLGSSEESTDIVYYIALIILSLIYLIRGDRFLHLVYVGCEWKACEESLPSSHKKEIAANIIICGTNIH